ncbi:hypothetical protein N7505_007329 [Penicillium chrysogenum]|uniref:FAD-binding FR-type domain-containing protein n=1 Tax=Penicillium chrysogenum TaxID=5076 RepID=A0ABQ8WDN6_PENCH|nr:hypothetical protein N7505_007329 [Penicillium chrysogenum]
MTVVLLSFHIIAELQGQTFSFPLSETRNLLTVIVSTPLNIGASALGILTRFSIPYFRRWSYELFLSRIFVYGTLQNLPSRSSWARLVLGSTTLLELALILYRNGIFSGRGAPRALISCSSKSIRRESLRNATAANIQIILPRPVKIEPRQYINLWMPSPRGRQDTLRLLVRHRKGFSADLIRHGALPTDCLISFLALFTGPHGTTENVGPYETTLIIATGFGIVTLIPYLKEMIHSCNKCTSHTRRLHLVWQTQANEEQMVSAAEGQLDDILEGDIIDKGYTLGISIYVEHDLANSRTPVEKHERIFYYQGVPHYRNIISTEASGSQIERLPNSPDEPGRTLVMGEQIPISYFPQTIAFEIVYATLREAIFIRESSY